MPVMFAGNVPLHTYRNPMLAHLRALNPDLIYVDNEPYTLSRVQLYLANQIINRRAIGFLDWPKYPEAISDGFRGLARAVKAARIRLCSSRDSEVPANFRLPLLHGCQP
jgi:hypothetical protein